MRRLVAAGLVATLLIAACGRSAGTTAPSSGGTAASTAVSSGAPATSQGAAVSGGTLNLATIAAAQPWDIKDAGLGHNTIYYQPVYDQLVRLDQNAEVTPNLATEWSYDDALTTLTLKLRNDVKFTDGTPFNAAAVKANLTNTKGGTSEAAGQLKGIESVEAVDDTTVKIKLAAPDPSFLANLGSTAGMMMSPAAIGTPTIATTPVGSGPYILDTGSTVPDAKYVFKRNPDYWNKAAFPFDSVVLNPLLDTNAVMNALQAGQVDGAYVSDLKNVATLQGAGLKILTYPSGDVQGLYLWDRAGVLNPALKDVRVRQAINYAFDRQAIIDKVLVGQAQSTTQLFNPDSVAYDTALNSTYTYDPAKAKQLLADAGYGDGFELVMPDLSAFNAGAQAAIVEQLGAIGIKVKLDTVPLDQLIDALLKGKYAASFFQLASFRPWDTVVLGLTKDSLWNPLKYEDPALTELITKAQNSTGAEQDGYFKQINKLTTEQAWDAVWDVPNTAYAHSDKINVTARKFAIEPFLYDFMPAQ